MAGLIAVIAGIVLIIYAIQHDKKAKDKKWLKDWGFWAITVLILIVGVLSLNDSSPSSIFTVVAFLALLGLLYWRITDRSKKDLHGKKKVVHTLLTILLVIVWFCICGPISTALQPKTNYKTAQNSDSSATSKYIRLDGQKIYYTDSKKYAIGGNPDTSWSAANAKVNSVTVYKIEKGYSYGSKRGRKSTQGLLAINVKVKALKDITVNMDSATVSIPSIDEQHDIETKEDWDDQDKGISKSGTLYVPIYKLNKINNVKSLRLKFDCQQQDNNDSIDADDFDHTYDMTIDLK